VGALAVCAALACTAHAATSAVITPSLSPNRLGAKTALTFTIHYAGGESGVPSAVRRSVLELPAGLSLDIPKLRICEMARLRAHGPKGCPAQSQLGSGHALIEAHAGSQTISEDVTLWVFLGPPQNLQPAFEILGQGYTPLDQQVVFAGTVLPGLEPYGEELSMAIPPIPTLPFESDASIVTLRLEIGARRHRLVHDSNALVMPSRCPAGGFPFAAEFTYADGSTGRAIATVPCPR
jgi:hypothetical protein